MHRNPVVAPERIMIATDLDDMECLLLHGIAQATAADSAVTIVHAINPMYVASLEAAVIPSDCETKLVSEVRAKLQYAAHQMVSEGIPVQITVRIGTAGDIIQQELQRSHSSRLIMGTHGRGLLRQFAMGSVAHQLIPHTHVPIFVVGPHAVTHALHTCPRRILHPVSFTGDYRKHCTLAMEIAAAYGAELTLLHVLEHPLNNNVNPQRSLQWAESSLRQIILQGPHPAPGIHSKVLFGKVAVEILKAASQTDADWIVLSTSDASHPGLLKQTRAFDVIAAAPCPVFTLGR